MRFFDRTEEIASLREIHRLAKENAQFTVVTGRRRIGKTSLVWKAYEEEPILYFFVARKAESDLCEDYQSEIENKLGIPTIGRAERFADVFEFLMKLSAERPITLFIDEFQEFFRVNKSVYSDMQRIWDMYSPKARINLIVCGSIYSLMTKIFKNKKEPLYNRQTRFMTVRPFTPTVLKDILAEYRPDYTAEDLLALYAFTGGVAKYVQLLVDAGATTKADMLDHIVKADSIFLGEGKAILIEEFGKDYGIYFSILSAIARGKTSRSEIENVVGRQIGGYLTKLESEYGSVKTIIDRDYETFSGLMLERWFKRVLTEQKAYTRIGGWWDRKGENEIDIVAENELDDAATFFEVKRKTENIDMAKLETKAAAFLRVTEAFRGYALSYKGLSMDDML